MHFLMVGNSFCAAYICAAEVEAVKNEEHLDVARGETRLLHHRRFVAIGTTARSFQHAGHHKSAALRRTPYKAGTFRLQDRL